MLSTSNGRLSTTVDQRDGYVGYVPLEGGCTARQNECGQKDKATAYYYIQESWIIRFEGFRCEFAGYRGRDSVSG